MGDIAVSIWTGVAAGVITSVFIALIVLVYKKLFLPWFEDKMYQGICIEGRWVLIDENTKGESMYAQKEVLELTQKASRLSGRLILVPKEGEDLKIRTLKVTGEIQDRFVMVTCVPETRDNLGYQVFLGEITGDGTTISGYAAFYSLSRNDNKVEQIVAAYKRE